MNSLFFFSFGLFSGYYSLLVAAGASWTLPEKVFIFLWCGVKAECQAPGLLGDSLTILPQLVMHFYNFACLMSCPCVAAITGAQSAPLIWNAAVSCHHAGYVMKNVYSRTEILIHGKHLPLGAKRLLMNCNTWSYIVMFPVQFVYLLPIFTWSFGHSVWLFLLMHRQAAQCINPPTSMFFSGYFLLKEISVTADLLQNWKKRTLKTPTNKSTYLNGLSLSIYVHTRSIC